MSIKQRLLHLNPFLLCLFAAIVANSCVEKNSTLPADSIATIQNEERFMKALQTHLDAVSERDLGTLEGSLSPEGDINFILPNRKMTTTAENFIQYHRTWFQDTTWTLETRIVSTEIGKEIGTAITEIVYRKPHRNGNPYFNSMLVSYALKKVEGKWYIFKDHASSIARSTEG